jgi:hypothetical protein
MTLLKGAFVMKSATIFSVFALATVTLAGSAFAFSQIQTDKGPRPIAVAQAEAKTDWKNDPRVVTTETLLIGNEDAAPANVPVPTARPAEFNFVPANVPVPTPRPLKTSKGPVPPMPIPSVQQAVAPLPKGEWVPVCLDSRLLSFFNKGKCKNPGEEYVLSAN